MSDNSPPGEDIDEPTVPGINETLSRDANHTNIIPIIVTNGEMGKSHFEFNLSTYICVCAMRTTLIVRTIKIWRSVLYVKQEDI